MKGVQCYELFGGIALKIHTFSFFIFIHTTCTLYHSSTVFAFCFISNSSRRLANTSVEYSHSNVLSLSLSDIVKKKGGKVYQNHGTFSRA